MREKPTLLLLHGGPGLDHSIYKPAFSGLSDVAQVVFYGASFGGTVALAYATRHPEHPAKLILVSTEAAAETHLDRRVALFERFGGPEVGALARRRFLESQGHAHRASVEAWLRLAFPLYTRTPRDPDVAKRAVRSLEVTHCPTLVLGGKTIR